MVNYEREIKRILVKNAGPLRAAKWLDSPCYFLENETPRQFISQGKGNIVLQTLNELYKFNEGFVLSESEPVPP